MRHDRTTTTASDLELLACWRAGDNVAGNALVKRHFGAMHRFFSNKTHTHHEDLIQQTFMACVESKDAFRGESSFRAYLFALARFQLLSHYRRVYRAAHVDFITTSACELATSPSGALDRSQHCDLLQRALKRVPLDQRVTLELTFWQDMTGPEIALLLNVPLNTVYSRLRRALEHLRTALERFSIDGAEIEYALRQLK